MLRPLLRHSQRLFRPFSSSPNPNPNPNPNPKPHFTEPLTTTLNKLFNEDDPDKLASSFIAAARSYRFRCRHVIYSVTVRRLAAAGRPDVVQSILEDQKQYTSDLSREGFAARIISLYGKARMASHAESTFRHLPSLGAPRTVLSFNALLTALSASGEFDRMNSLFKEIPFDDSTIVPNAISYNILMRGFIEKEDFDSAVGILDLMKEKGISPDLFAFNTLLNGFYGKNRFLDAEVVWERMKEEDVKPDVMSYNAKMRGLVDEGRVEEAVEIVEELRRIGLKPDTFTFNAVIKGYCKEGRLEEAKRVYGDLIKNDCAPNKGTFEVMIPSLCEAGEVGLALKLCNDCMSRKCFVDVEVLQRVVEGLAKEARVEEAKKLVKLGRENKYSRKMLKMPA